MNPPGAERPGGQDTLWPEQDKTGRRLRIAVVGAGQIARRFHLPSLRRMAAEGAPIELVALCDIDPACADEMARQFGFNSACSDYRALLDAHAPDAVWVLVPIPATREVAGYFLGQGVPTLMEKPPGQDTIEAQQLLELAQAQDTRHQVAFNRRHAPTLVHMRQLLREAGPLTALSCQFYRSRRGEPYFAYGTGLHGLDAMRFLADTEVREVHARPGPRGSAVVTLAHDNGALGVMEMLPQVGVQSERYTAHAGERTVTVDGVVSWLTLFPGFLQCFEAGKETLLIDNRLDPLPPEVVSGFYGESAHFVRCLLRGERPSPDLALSLRSVEIAETVAKVIDENDRRGQRIVFPS
jgi:predicted dehydrogenase